MRANPLFLAVICACSPPPAPIPGSDAGTDAGAEEDAGGGGPDAGSPDAGPADSGAPDAGPPDSGTSAHDAGRRDTLAFFGGAHVVDLRNPDGGFSRFQFGRARCAFTALLPVAGDFDGDDTDTVGFYDLRTGLFQLMNDNTSALPALELRTPPLAGLPVAGDWDGDGTTGVGVWFADGGLFQLKNTPSPGPPDLSFVFGAPGQTTLAISGDFDGDGSDSVGTFDVATAEFRLRNALSAGLPDLTFRFGPPGSLPVVGDWDGDGTDTIGVYDPATRRVFLRNSNSAGTEDLVVAAPSTAWPLLPVAGHFEPVPPQPTRGFAWQTASPAAQSIDAGTLALASQRARFLPFVTSFLVARNGRLVHEEYLHGADRNQLHNVKSVSKSLATMLTLLAVQQQRVTATATLDQLLPEYFDGGTAPAKRQITLSHLLNMRAGLAWDDAAQLGEMFRTDDWVQFTIDRPMAAAPGAVFNYSTGVSHLTAAALSRAVAPQRLDAWADASLFGPAGITWYRWDRELDGRPFGGAEMYFTARDLLRLAQLNLDHGRLDGQQIIDAMLVDATTGLASGYAAYWWFKTVRGHQVFYGLGHGGQLMYHVRSLGLVAVVTAYPEVSYADSTQQQQQIMQFLDDYVIPSAQ